MTKLFSPLMRWWKAWQARRRRMRALANYNAACATAEQKFGEAELHPPGGMISAEEAYGGSPAGDHSRSYL